MKRGKSARAQLVAFEGEKRKRWGDEKNEKKPRNEGDGLQGKREEKRRNYQKGKVLRNDELIITLWFPNCGEICRVEHMKRKN